MNRNGRANNGQRLNTETLRALCIVCLPVAALLWLILEVGAVFTPDVTRDGWIGLATCFGIVL